ncbi:hypothetical protein ES319_A08G214200v1 [Gossypium barbadense]|uniref:Uncharacterized protein n=2 Tax=Gossypium TaxID=3633 RepID=A0A5J5UUY0_GOSBA|nr:hypothetical protein ES319_A08G214200v1 [Gossypium barbadense]TYH07487.1 hypothetical protein ES288_A08G237400v1 [Gossypium darwinii]
MADHGFLGGPPRPRTTIGAEWHETAWSISKQPEDGIFVTHRNEREKKKEKRKKKKKEGPPPVPCSLPRPLAEPPMVQRPPNRLGNAGTPLPNNESEDIRVSDAWSVMTKAEMHAWGVVAKAEGYGPWGWLLKKF